MLAVAAVCLFAIHALHRPAPPNAGVPARHAARRIRMTAADARELARQREMLNSLFRAAPSDRGANEPARCAHEFPSLPLWRTQWVSLPAHNELLNVHVPHYTHMFTELMRTERPWFFGSFYLEGGSRNLGSDEHALSPGEIGVLCEVVSCTRLDDGRLMLATRSVGRLELGRVCQVVPYSVADCEYFSDDEELELFDEIAIEAAATFAPDSATSEAIAGAVQRAALAAASSAACEWASRERALAAAPGALSPYACFELGTGALVARATEAVVDTASKAASRAAHRALGLSDEDARALDDVEPPLDSPPPLELGEYDGESESESGLASWREWQANEEMVSLPGLELCVWNELIACWALAGKLGETGFEAALPDELLALLPPTPEGGWDQCPDTPMAEALVTLPGPLRRARASFLLLTALLPELVETTEQRRDLLETRELRTRLLLIAHQLEKQRKMLSAVLALRDAMPDSGTGPVTEEE
jgi:Lon protease-like protein